jgi:hypothetical protein
LPRRFFDRFFEDKRRAVAGKTRRFGHRKTRVSNLIFDSDRDELDAECRRDQVLVCRLFGGRAARQSFERRAQRRFRVNFSFDPLQTARRLLGIVGTGFQ